MLDKQAFVVQPLGRGLAPENCYRAAICLYSVDSSPILIDVA